MFDGNHRSRRNVYLGSRRVRSRTAQDKAAILAHTEQLRKERHAEQQRQGSAIRLQQHVRGFLSRQRLWNECTTRLLLLSSDNVETTLSLEQHCRLLNYMLSWSRPENKLCLQRFAGRLLNNNTTTTTITTLPDHVWIHRIVQACLRMLTQTTTTTTDDSSFSLPLLLALWQACQTMVPVSSPRFLGQGIGGKIILAEATVATNLDILFETLQVLTREEYPALLASVGWVLGRFHDDTSLHLVVQVLADPPSNDVAQAARRLAPTQVILQRALPRPILLPLVLQLWREDPALLAMTQWLVWGKKDTDLGKTSHHTTKTMDSDDNSDDDYDDDVMDVDVPARTARRVSKPQIATLPRLDRLARDTQDKWRHATWALAKDKERRTKLATILSHAALWMAWGKSCLSAGTDTLAVHYVTALAQIIPTSLLARTTATSPVLNKLAFDTEILHGLWRVAQAHPESLVALTVLSNVLAQTLMVIKDDEFLSAYSGPHATISVVNLITILREALYRVYWVVPVQVDDVTAAFQGVPDTLDAHFLLAGTKLYNALYQRWCRLVRHKDNFASEGIWWFPNLSTTSTRVQLDAPVDDRIDSDSSDDDGDDDAMDISPADAESEALAAAFDDPKLSRVLTSIPQALPFEKRVKLFDSLVKADKTTTQDESAMMQNALAAMLRGEEDSRGRQRVEIRREYLYQDAMQQLNNLRGKLRQKVQISFINQHGAAEAGIDGGGVFKEFLDDLVRDAFSSGETSSSMLPLFKVTPLETLAVNLDYANRPDLLSHYEFLGRAIGKAVYEGILVDPQFCLPFLNGLLGKSNSLEDLKNYDPEYYKNLTKLLSLKSADFAGLGLTFDVSVGSSGRTVELMPGGSREAVTPENVIRYAHLVAHQLLNVQAAGPVRAFLRGFRDLIPAPWVRLFAAHELQLIISGDDRGLDVASFKSIMQYAAGYHPSQPIVQWFWEIVEKDLTQDQQCKLLKFMTSCSRQPLLGFSSLEPAPCIQQIRLPETLFLREPADILKQAPLPTSSTCMNLLKLPNYRSKELMRVKLIAAIESGAGFELT